MADEEKSYVRSEEIADFCGLSVRHIQHLTQDGIIKSQPPPSGGRGRVYEFLPTVRALLMHYREKASKKNAPSDAMQEEKLRQLAAKREREEMRLMTEKRLLHHTADIERVFGAMVARLRVGLLALPQGVAPVLLEQTDINTVAGIITDRLHRCLTELSEFDFAKFAETEGEYIAAMEAGDTNGKADSERTKPTTSSTKKHRGAFRTNTSSAKAAAKNNDSRVGRTKKDAVKRGSRSTGTLA